MFIEFSGLFYNKTKANPDLYFFGGFCSNVFPIIVVSEVKITMWRGHTTDTHTHVWITMSQSYRDKEEEANVTSVIFIVPTETSLVHGRACANGKKMSTEAQQRIGGHLSGQIIWKTAELRAQIHHQQTLIPDFYFPNLCFLSWTINLTLGPKENLLARSGISTLPTGGWQNWNYKQKNPKTILNQFGATQD